MEFDKNLAASLIGKYILIGLTYLDTGGKLESQEQLHGIVLSVSEIDGILIQLKGTNQNQEWNMPPSTEGITIADPGIYKIRSTGEEIKNPDFLCTWQIHKSSAE